MSRRRTATTQNTESPGNVLEGLHAKLVVADVPYGGRVWTGSANLTDAAFGGNVEFIAELRGPKRVCGIDSIIGDQTTRIGLRKLVEPYEPATPDGRGLTEIEQAEQRLDWARRVLGRLRYTATCRKDESDKFDLELTGVPLEGVPLDPASLDGLAATIRPVTLGDGGRDRDRAGTKWPDRPLSALVRGHHAVLRVSRLGRSMTHYCWMPPSSSTPIWSARQATGPRM